MREVSIVGIGSTTFGRHAATPIEQLGVQAAVEALLDAGIEMPPAFVPSPTFTTPSGGWMCIYKYMSAAAAWSTFVFSAMRTTATH